MLTIPTQNVQTTQIQGYFNENTIPSLPEAEQLQFIGKYLFDFQSKSNNSMLSEEEPNIVQQNSQAQKEKKNRKRKRRLSSKKKVLENHHSRYHNFQKHLANALKSIVRESIYQHSDRIDEKIASLIWKAFKRSKIQSRKIIYFLFNDQANNTIKEYELRNFKLFEIYLKFGSEMFASGKRLLKKWACEQMDEDAIDGYLNSRRILRRGEFKEYILEFKEEIESGGIGKRIKLHDHY